MDFTSPVNLSALACAQQALDRMDHFHIPPTPENYTVWFHYFSGTSPLLKHAIDILSLSADGVTAEKCGELYRHFLSGAEAEQDVVYNANERLQTTLDTLLHLVESNSRHTASFNQNLSKSTEKLAVADGTRDILSVVAQMVQDTKVMLLHNNTLQTQLSASSQEMTELKQNLDTARQEALIDALTGITNRKGFDIKFLNEAAAATEDKTPLSLLMIDIDYFKKFNDTFGHQTGDLVLKLVGATLVGCIKGQDTAARFGGEEFAVLLPNTKIEHAVRVAEILRQTIAGKEITNKMTREKLGQINFSIGATEYRAGEMLADCIERADQALYAAKKNGRNRVEISR